MSSKYYSAPWGTKIWLITGIVLGLGVAVAGTFPFFLNDEKGPLLLRLLPTITIITIFASTSLFVVRGFELTDKQLFVRRSFWKNQIDLAGLDSITADPEACKAAFKTLGNDGLFSMSGRFRSKRLGSFRAFVTAPKNSVILKFPDRTIVVSPENPKNFVNELNRRLRRNKDSS